jgi:hypothetical protein
MIRLRVGRFSTDSEEACRFPEPAPFADKLPSHDFRLEGSTSLHFSILLQENLPVERL